jgi:methionine-rich copper-binding protein CopC
MKLKITFAAAAVGFLLTMAGTAVLGHAALESSDPADGATITTPYTLTATFDEELTPDGSSIKVQAANGTEVGSGTVSGGDAKQMTIDLSVLPEGTYEVLWTAVTADDLGVTRGTYKFTVAAAVPSTTAVPTNAPSNAPSPQPSAAPGTATGSNNDLLIALVLAAVIIATVVGFVLYRNRR